MKVWVWDTEIVFICLQVNIYYKLLQLFEKIFEFDIFYRDPKKCLSPLRISLHDWRKIETIRERRYKKEKLKVQQNNLALFRRKHGVAYEDGSDKERT